MNATPGVLVRRAPGALSRRAGTDVLVANLAGDDVRLLSGGASSVWAALQTPRSLPELVDRLAAVHGMTPQALRAEVESCLDTLLALGLVEEVQGADG